MPVRSILLAFLAVITLSGCWLIDIFTEPKDPQKEVEAASLRREKQNLSDTKRWLDDHPTRQSRGDMKIFLSTDVLDRILAGADNYQIRLPENYNIIMEVRQIRTAFRDGFPLLDIDAVARAPDLTGELEVILEITALLDIDDIVRFQPDTEVGIEVLGVVPKLQYGQVNVGIGKLGEAILSLQALQYSKTFPKYTLPLEDALNIDVPSERVGGSTKFPSKWTMAVGGYTPRISRDIVINVNKILTLYSGLYVFAEMTAVEP